MNKNEMKFFLLMVVVESSYNEYMHTKHTLYWLLLVVKQFFVHFFSLFSFGFFFLSFWQ